MYVRTPVARLMVYSVDFFLGGTDSFVAMMERRACVIWMLLGLFLREAAAQDLAPEEGKTTAESETHDRLL